MTAPNILWQPWPGFQTRALECGTNEALFGGAAGPGKTDVLIACGARYCQREGARVLFLRTSYTDLQDVRDRMAVLYPALGAVWQAEPKRWLWPSGAVLEMGYGETVAEVSRYVGREYTAVLFDELGLVADPLVWSWLRSRVRSTSGVPLRMRASANPGGAGHAWLKERFVTPTEGGSKDVVEKLDDGSRWTIAYVPGTAKDNPSLPSSYWSGLAFLPPAMRAALRDGDWDAGIGLFYPEVAGKAGEDMIQPWPKRLPEWWDYWGGYDWGFRHPAVFVACARDGDGRVWVLDTVYMHRLSDAEQAAEIRGLVLRDTQQVPQDCLRRVYGGHDAWYARQAHSAAPETVADVMERSHIGLYKANLDRAAGSRSLRRLMADGKLLLADTLGNRRLLTDLQGLVPDPLKPECPRKVDADADSGMGGDDAPDALRYALATVPWLVAEPEEVRVADDPNKFAAPWAVHGEGQDVAPETKPGELGGFLSQFPEGYA